MKKIFAALLIVLTAGCAAQEQRRAMQFAQEYAADMRPRAERGEINWSAYYRGLYNYFSAANAPGDVLSRVNGLIRTAEDYEAGRISLQDLQYARREADSQNRIAHEARAQQQAQQSAANLAAAAQLLQASGPRVLAPQPVAAAPAGAGIVGFYQSQSTNGTLRYCRYSNGVITTINIVGLCPMNTQ